MTKTTFRSFEDYRTYRTLTERFKGKIPAKEDILSDLEQISALCELESACERHQFIDGFKRVLGKGSPESLLRIINGLDSVKDRDQDAYDLINVLCNVAAYATKEAAILTLRHAFVKHRGEKIGPLESLNSKEDIAVFYDRMMDVNASEVNEELQKLIECALKEVTDPREKTIIELSGEAKKREEEVWELYRLALSKVLSHYNNEATREDVKRNVAMYREICESEVRHSTKPMKFSDRDNYLTFLASLHAVIDLIVDPKDKYKKRQDLEMMQERVDLMRTQRQLKEEREKHSVIDGFYKFFSMLASGGTGFGLAYLAADAVSSAAYVTAPVAAGVTLGSYATLTGIPRAAACVSRWWSRPEPDYIQELFKPSLQGVKRISTEKCFTRSR